MRDEQRVAARLGDLQHALEEQVSAADARLPSGLYGGLAGSWSKQTYDFSTTTPGGEQITDGDDIDTAPRTLASARAAAEGPEHVLEAVAKLKRLVMITVYTAPWSLAVKGGGV